MKLACVDDEGTDDLSDIALQIEAVVANAVAENSLSPQNIESAVRKNLLPLLFKKFGLDRAKSITDKIVEVTKLGLARGDL